MNKNILAALICWCLTASFARAADTKTKIILIGKDRDHPYATHTYMNDCEQLAIVHVGVRGVRVVAILADQDDFGFGVGGAGEGGSQAPTDQRSENVLVHGSMVSNRLELN